MSLLRAAALFTLLVLLFFAPALMGLRILAPVGDGLFYYYPVRAYSAEVLSRGQIPLWNPLMFSGFPFLADVETGVFYPPNWLFLVLPHPVAMNLIVLATYVLAGVSTCLLARSIGADPLGGFVSGLSFMLGGFMVSHLGHVTVITAAAWLPLLLFFLEKLRTAATVSAAMGVALCLSMQILGGHPQVVLYSTLLAVFHLGFFGLLDSPPSGRRAFLSAAMAGLAAALLTAACQIAPSLELVSLSGRAGLSYADFVDFSLPISHLLLFLFPHLFGGFSEGTFPLAWWGHRETPTEFCGYVGLAPILLTLVALVRIRRSRHALFWTLLVVLAALLALGGNTFLSRLAYHVPVYNLFRAPARHLLELSLALSILAGLGATSLSQSQASTSSRSVGRVALVGLGLIGGLALLLCWRGAGLAAVAGLTPSDPGRVFSPSNPAILMPALLAALASGSWWWLARRPSQATRVLAVVLVFVDLCSFGQFGSWRFSPRIDARREEQAVLASLMQVDARARDYRFVSLAQTQDDSLASGASNAGGSSSMALGRYVDLLEGMDPLSGTVLDASRFYEGRALDLLNVRYLVVPRRLLDPPPVAPGQDVRPYGEGFDLKLSRDPNDRLDSTLPPISCSAIAVTADSLDGRVEDGDALLRLTVWTAAGRRIERVLRAGWDDRGGDARGAWSWSGLRRRLARLGHGLMEPDERPHRSVADLGGPQPVERIRLDYAARSRSLAIREIALYDPTSRRSLLLVGREARGSRLSGSSGYVEVTPDPAPASAVVLVSSLSQAIQVRQGEPVAKVSVWTAEGRVVEKVLRAGEDTSEWAWDRWDVRFRVRHRKAPVAEGFGGKAGGPRGHVSRIELGGRTRVEKIAIEFLEFGGRLRLAALSLADPVSGAATPVPLDQGLVEEQASRSTLKQLEWAPPPVRCSSIDLVSSLEHSVSVSDGEPVARLSVWTTEGKRLEKILRAGEDTSEWAWERPDVRARVRHARAPVAEGFAVAGAGYRGHWYRSRLDLGGSRRVERVGLSALTPRATLVVSRVALNDAETGRSLDLHRREAAVILARDETRPAVDLAVPSVACSSLVLASSLSHSLSIEQGAPVARVTVWTDAGERIERWLRAGEHTSEWSWDDPETRARVRHSRAPVAPGSAWRGESRGRDYLGRVELGGRHRIVRVRIAAEAAAAVLSVTGLAFHDPATGLLTPFSMVRSQVLDETRWRKRLASDGTVVYENARALPRAWLVPRVLGLGEQDVLRSIHTGMLPDGTPFEPERLALVSEGPGREGGPPDPAARAEIVEYQDRRIRVKTRSGAPSFLVMSEVAYPGWKATLDGAPAPIVRTDHVLRGLALPAGDHEVRFVYEPPVFELGAVVSGVALLGWMAALWSIARRRGGRRRAVP